MLQRKRGKASNTWYKLGRPLITSGETAGQRDQERIMATIQVIPEEIFGPFGERKVTGFTLSEIAEVVETGVAKILRLNPEDPDSTIVARIVPGAGLDEFTRPELQRILTEMGGTVLSSPSPMDDKDRMRIKLERDLEPKSKGGRPKKIVVVADTTADGPDGAGPTGSPDSAAGTVSE